MLHGKKPHPAYIEGVLWTSIQDIDRRSKLLTAQDTGGYGSVWTDTSISLVFLETFRPAAPTPPHSPCLVTASPNGPPAVADTSLKSR